ncbi:MAG: hypothetical protein ACPLXM_12645 [Bacteroidales bacterium]
MDYQEGIKKHLIYKAFVQFARQFPVETYLLNRDMYMRHVLEQIGDPAELPEIEAVIVEDVVHRIEAESNCFPDDEESFPLI